MMQNIVKFWRSVGQEARQVVWPTRKEIGITTLMILVMASVAGTFFFFVDWGMSQAIRFILELNL